jgi:hypothetical protein
MKFWSLEGCVSNPSEEPGTIGCPIGEEGPLGPPGEDAPIVKPDEPKRRGRPRTFEEPCGSLSVRLPTRVQDRVIKLSKQQRQTPSEFLRNVVINLFGR